MTDCNTHACCNRDEEKEHASMLLEWLRRRNTAFTDELKDHLFTGGDILELEKEG